MFKPGNHEVKVGNYGLSQKDGGGANVFLEFVREDGETMLWYGSLGTDKSQEYCAEKLLLCGFKGSSFKDLTKDNAFNDTIVKVRVEEETYNGETRNKITGISGPNSGIKKMTAAEAQSIFGAEGKFMQLKEKMGLNQSSNLQDLPNHAPTGNNLGF